MLGGYDQSLKLKIPKFIAWEEVESFCCTHAIIIFIMCYSQHCLVSSYAPEFGCQLYFCSATIMWLSLYFIGQWWKFNLDCLLWHTWYPILRYIYLCLFWVFLLYFFLLLFLCYVKSSVSHVLPSISVWFRNLKIHAYWWVSKPLPLMGPHIINPTCLKLQGPKASSHTESGVLNSRPAGW